MKVRIATPQDFEKLIKLADELIRLEDWKGREMMLTISLQDSNHSIHVAEIDGKIVGFVELRIFPDFVEGAPIAIVQNIIVEKNYRNLSIGSKLLKRVVKEAEKLNTIEIHVWTEFSNQQAIDFYVDHGFENRALLLERELQTKEKS